MQSADERATDVCDAFRLTLLQRMNQEESHLNLEAELTPADVDRIANAMISKPDWFPEVK